MTMAAQTLLSYGRYVNLRAAAGRRAELGQAAPGIERRGFHRGRAAKVQNRRFLPDGSHRYESRARGDSGGYDREPVGCSADGPRGSACRFFNIWFGEENL